MAKIYRYEIETRFGNRGAYTAYTSCRHPSEPITREYTSLHTRMCNAHGNITHPGARIDFDTFNENYYCACLSIKDLKQWFKGFNAPLLRLGFKLVEYEVKSYDVSKSGLQCSFKEEWVISKRVIQ